MNKHKEQTVAVESHWEDGYLLDREGVISSVNSI